MRPLHATSSLGAVVIDGATQLDDLLDALQRLADERGVGQSVELRADGDEALVVDVDVTPGGWGLEHSSSHTRTASYTVNGSGSTDAVELQWGGEWVELEQQCFVAPAAARAAVHEYLATRRLGESVTWVTVGGNVT